jgi:hypothetical protein
MRRWLVCLALLALVGCIGAPGNQVRRAGPDEEGVEPPETLPAPEITLAADATKTARLPHPDSEPAVLDAAAMRELAKTDPVAFVSRVIERYDREVKSYTCTLEKQERVGGKLKPVEVVQCWFREKPFSVRMDWKKGASKAQKTAYVEGENGGKLLALPTGLAALVGVVARDPVGDEAKSTSRYPVTEFGIQVGTHRTLAAWKEARKRGDLKVEFNGVKKLKELDDRPAWELKRVGYKKPEDDGILEATLYFDVENWLQVGSMMTGEDGKLIGKYYFRDLKLNPEIDGEAFSREALARKK